MKNLPTINETFSQTYKDNFFDYVKDNKYKKVKSYLMNGMNPNQVNSFNNAPLFVSTKHFEVFKLMLDYNANPMIRTKVSNLLHVASFEGNFQVIEYILETLKFDINELSEENKPPLQYVMESWKSNQNDHSIEKMMVEKGANLNLVNFKYDNNFFKTKLNILKEYQLSIQEKDSLETIMQKDVPLSLNTHKIKI